METYLNDKIRALIVLIENVAPIRFKDQIRKLKGATFRVKFAFELFPSKITTWGDKNVSLTSGFFKLGTARQTELLIHEATHMLQYERLGSRINFWTKYLLNIKSFEDEATQEELEWKRIARIS